MVVALFNETPLHRDNFLAHVRRHDYDSLLVNRVVPGFILEAGDPATRPVRQGRQKAMTLSSEPVPGLVHTKGALGALPLEDNPEHTEASRFYIVLGRTYTASELEQVSTRLARQGTPVAYTPVQRKRYAELGGAPHLDGGYTVFGEVVEGLEVLDAIAKRPCGNDDRPLSDLHTFMRILQ